MLTGTRNFLAETYADDQGPSPTPDEISSPTPVDLDKPSERGSVLELIKIKFCFPNSVGLYTETHLSLRKMKTVNI